jgi:hypothetical protein
MAIGLTTLVAPMAHAAGTTVHGGCFFDTNSQATATNGQYVGVIGDHSVTTTDATPPTPVSATIGCEIQVNGNVAVGPFFYGDLNGVTGVQLGQNAPISFTAADDADVELCQNVNGGSFSCSPATSLQIPPQPVIDALNTVNDELIALQKQFTDPTTCALLGAHPGTYGPFTVDPSGDVTGPDPLDLGLNPYWDCPPYVS